MGNYILRRILIAIAITQFMPQLLQEDSGYTATWAGLVLSLHTAKRVLQRRRAYHCVHPIDPEREQILRQSGAATDAPFGFSRW